MFEYRQYLRYIREMEERENERIRQAQERGVELVDIPEPEISEDFLEEQYEEEEQDDLEVIADDEAAEPDEDVTEHDNDLDVFEVDSAFLENIIMCTMEVIPEGTSESLTEHDDEETEPLLDEGQAEQNEIVIGVNDEAEEIPDETAAIESSDDEIADFLEEYCDEKPRRSFFGRFRHGH